MQREPDEVERIIEREEDEARRHERQGDLVSHVPEIHSEHAGGDEDGGSPQDERHDVEVVSHGDKVVAAQREEAFHESV